jgi:3-oxoacyl-[acyl-carrier protein] reductase
VQCARDAAHTLAQGAIEQAIRPLSKALGAKGIRVVCLAPGPTDTELFRGPKTEEQIKFFENLSPFKRLGMPEEMAKVASAPSAQVGAVRR